MTISPQIRERVKNHAFLSDFGCDFMRLWEIKDVSKIYEIVLINVAAKQKLCWKQIYVFDSESEFFPQLCVAVLIIFDALKYVLPDQKTIFSAMQPNEIIIIKSYYNL